MKPLRVAALALAIAAAGAAAGAQSNSPPAASSSPGVAPPATGPTGQMPMHHPMGMHQMGGMPGHEAMGGMMAHGSGQQAAIPTEPGQAAFGAIQEIVGDAASRSANRLVQGRRRCLATASDRHGRSDDAGDSAKGADRERPAHQGDRQRPHVGGDPAHGAGACP